MSISRRNFIGGIAALPTTLFFNHKDILSTPKTITKKELASSSPQMIDGWIQMPIKKPQCVEFLRWGNNLDSFKNVYIYLASKAESPKSLTIDGSHGSGKTQLLDLAIVLARKINPEILIQYMNAHQFRTSAVLGLSQKNLRKMQEALIVRPDLLIIDDVQFLAGSEFMQELLHSIYEERAARDKKMLFTFSQDTNDKLALRPFLKSRLESHKISLVNQVIKFG